MIHRIQQSRNLFLKNLHNYLVLYFSIIDAKKNRFLVVLID